jgi:hypothetical protein
MLFAKYKRRGNLPSVVNSGELFRTISKNTPLQEQNREIAEEPLVERIMLSPPNCADNEILPPAKGFSSGMTQRCAESMFATPSTKPRNDGMWCKVRRLQNPVFFMAN